MTSRQILINALRATADYDAVRDARREARKSGSPIPARPSEPEGIFLASADQPNPPVLRTVADWLESLDGAEPAEVASWCDRFVAHETSEGVLIDAYGAGHYFNLRGDARAFTK